MKKIDIPRKIVATPEAWIQNSEESIPEVKLGRKKTKFEVSKRLTLDIPEDLHTQFKVDCALRQTTMLADIIDWLRQRYEK